MEFLSTSENADAVDRGGDSSTTKPRLMGISEDIWNCCNVIVSIAPGDPVPLPGFWVCTDYSFLKAVFQTIDGKPAC
jgi:hypothetical protein